MTKPLVAMAIDAALPSMFGHRVEGRWPEGAAAGPLAGDRGD